MKIIHTADIHLDSPLTHSSNPQKRRLELLQALSNLGEYANNNGVQVVIVAGDLFDDKYTSAKTVQGVADIIAQSGAKWCILQGNHGDNTPYDKLKAICPQVLTFGEQWTSHLFDDVNVCGRELGVADQYYWQNLSLPSDKFNVLVLHGDVDDDAYGIIDKKVIANSGANYVALGHRHSFATHKFGKVNACYCGVLECRGFDENSQTGFVLLDTQTNSVNFVKQSIRTVENVTVDVSAIKSEIALEKLLMQCLAEVSSRNYLNLTFVGTLSENVRLSTAQAFLQGKFFGLRIQDKTQPSFDVAKIAEEVSLRGEFVRQVLQLPTDEQAEVLKLGLTLLSGGDLQ